MKLICQQRVFVMTLIGKGIDPLLRDFIGHAFRFCMFCNNPSKFVVRCAQKVRTFLRDIV